jgi:hypothetical protein
LELLLNFGLAWVSVILTLCLCVIYILTIIFHVIQVGGIQVHKLLLGGDTSSMQKVTVNELNKTMQGATFTSIGIMNATNNALSKALIDGTLPINQALPANRGHGGGKRGSH